MAREKSVYDINNQYARIFSLGTRTLDHKRVRKAAEIADRYVANMRKAKSYNGDGRKQNQRTYMGLSNG